MIGRQKRYDTKNPRSRRWSRADVLEVPERPRHGGVVLTMRTDTAAPAIADRIAAGGHDAAAIVLLHSDAMGGAIGDGTPAVSAGFEARMIHARKGSGMPLGITAMGLIRAGPDSAGPLHACRLARTPGILLVIVRRGAGAASPLGLLVADPQGGPRHDPRAAPERRGQRPQSP